MRAGSDPGVAEHESGVSNLVEAMGLPLEQHDDFAPDFGREK